MLLLTLALLCLPKHTASLPNVQSHSEIAVSETGDFLWPVGDNRHITSGFGNRKIALYGYERLHTGIDINTATGTPVTAIEGGTVIVSVYDGGWGDYIMINHGNGRVTLYAHMSSRAVAAGANVNKGQVIGFVGSTGNSTGPHLHFEVRVNGSATDPCNYFTGYYFTK